MMYLEIKERIEEIIVNSKETLTMPQIREELEQDFNMIPSKSTLYNRMGEIRDRLSENEKEKGENIEIIDDKSKKDKSMQVENKKAVVQTAEELCIERGIDLTKWKIVKIRIGKHSVPIKDDFNQKIVTVEAPNIQVQLERWYVEEDKTSALKTIYEMGKSKSWQVNNYGVNNNNRMAVFNASDLHLGKIAYKYISGDEYNIATAIDRLKNKVGETLTEMSAVGIPSEIMVIIGNDGLHIDGPKNTTTKGTPQDVDGMYQNAKNSLTQLRFELIETLSKYAKLKIVNVKGNHDEYSSIDIASILRAYYYHNPNINFNEEQSFEESPMINSKPRQSVSYGDNLFVMTHGNQFQSEGKVSGLSIEVRQRFGHLINSETKVYVFLGHLHTRKKYIEKLHEQIGNITVYYLPSLSGTDKRHDDNGYIGNEKLLETMIFDKDKGQRMTILT